MTLPKIACWISFGSTCARSIAAFDANTPRSMALKSLSVPPKVPNGVRTPERKTMSRLVP